MIDLSIIIPCYKNESFTEKLLYDLIKLDGNKHEIFIFDNGAGESKDTCNIISQLGAFTKANLSYYSSQENIGFSCACNKGQQLSKGSNILFLNNDVRVTKNYDAWTKDIIKECQAGNLVAAQSGLLDEKFNFVKEENKLMKSKYAYLSGWCLGGSRETLNKLKID